MKHQPAGSGYRCAVYTMRQWVQVSGNLPGLAPERDRSCGPHSWPLVTTGSWVSHLLECFGGKVTEQNTVVPPLTFLRSTLEGFTIQLCLPKSGYLQYLYSPAAYTYVLKYFHSSAVFRDSYLKSPLITDQLCYMTPARGCLQSSCITWPLPEGCLLNSPAVLYTT